MADTTYKGKLRQNLGTDGIMTLHPETDASVVLYNNTIEGTAVTNIKGALDYIIANGLGTFEDLGTITQDPYSTTNTALNSLADGYYVFTYSSMKYILTQSTGTGSTIIQYILSGSSLITRTKTSGTWAVSSQTFQNTSNLVTSISSSSTDTQYPSAKAVYTNLQLKENVANKTTSFSTNPSNVKYPSEKLVKDNIDALQDEIDNLRAIGRFLSGWDCATGQPTTQPQELPYAYHTGDYFIVSNVPTSGNVYIPSGSSYTGTASTTTTTEVVKANDYFRYDGTTWKLEINTQRTITWGSIEGTLSQQNDLQNALNDLQNNITALSNSTTTALADKYDTVETTGSGNVITSIVEDSTNANKVVVTKDLSVYSKSEVDTALNNKVSKITASGGKRVYGVTTLGAETTYEVSNVSLAPSTTNAGQLVVYDSNAQIKVKTTPSANNDATSKKYVDDGLSAKADKNSVTAGTYSVVSFNSQGVITAGGQVFEVIDNGDTPSVVTGGLYFEKD